MSDPLVPFPVRYTEQGLGLHAAVAAAGFLLRQIDGAWFASDPSVQQIIDNYNPLPAVQSAAMIAAQAHYDAIIAAGFFYQGKSFQIDPASQANMAAAGAMALGSITNPASNPWPAAFDWIAVDNSRVPMTAPQTYAFTYAAGGYVSACILYHRSLKDQILAATSAAAAQAIDVTAGWPANGG
ncbi:MAG TPA: DUF4376 domain-containing protein [Aliidongia sp.]|nr:DUF4376 domain-containing protein [Aliidongia sp.]